MLAGLHRDLGEVARRRAVELHVSPRALGVELRRREHADRRLELGGERELRELLQAGRDAGAGIAGAADRDQHVLADAGRHGHRRALDRGDAGRPAHRHEQRQREIGQAEIGDEILGDAAAGEIGNDAVDVCGLEARILDRLQAGLELQRQKLRLGAERQAVRLEVCRVELGIPPCITFILRAAPHTLTNEVRQ